MTRNKDELLLHARLIPVGRDFHAKAGQRVIVVAGLAVGVYTGDEHVPLLEREEPSKAFAQIQVDPIRSTPTHPPQKNHASPYGSYRLKDGSPVRTVVPVIEAVRGVLSALPPGASCVRSDLFAAAGIEPSSKQEWKMRAAISLLLESEEVILRSSGNRKKAYQAGPNLQRNIERTGTP